MCLCLNLDENICHCTYIYTCKTQCSDRSLVSMCRYRELEEKLDYLQKSSAQRDRTEALLKQKDKDCAQV